jgi:hypothetical protein
MKAEQKYAPVFNQCTASGELFRGDLPHWCPVKNMNNGYKTEQRDE